MGKFEDLESLKRLKDSGSITEEEFRIEKQKILNEKDENKKINKKNLTPKQIIIGVILAVLIAIVALFIIEKIALSLRY